MFSLNCCQLSLYRSSAMAGGGNFWNLFNLQFGWHRTKRLQNSAVRRNCRSHTIVRWDIAINVVWQYGGLFGLESWQTLTLTLHLRQNWLNWFYWWWAAGDTAERFSFPWQAQDIIDSFKAKLLKITGCSPCRQCSDTAKAQWVDLWRGRKRWRLSGTSQKERPVFEALH